MNDKVSRNWGHYNEWIKGWWVYKLEEMKRSR